MHSFAFIIVVVGVFMDVRRKGKSTSLVIKCKVKKSKLDDVTRFFSNSSAGKTNYYRLNYGTRGVRKGLLATCFKGVSLSRSEFLNRDRNFVIETATL